VAAGDRGWAEKLLGSAEPGAVSWIGPLDEKQRWEFLRDCDLLALPSYFENFGMAAGEALAAGRPVVVGRETAWSEVEQAGFGVVVEPTPDSIAEGIRRVLADPDLRARARSAAPRWIRENFSWDAVGQKMEKVYESAISGNVSALEVPALEAAGA
jgi:glycosyltransferase involved in cell wall biosynthesis